MRTDTINHTCICEDCQVSEKLVLINKSVKISAKIFTETFSAFS